MLPRLLIVVGIALTSVAPGLAEDRVGDVRILAAWARASPGPTAAAYLELRNEGKEDDRLVGASTPLAERVEFHEHRHTGEVMSMAAAPAIVLPPAETVRLRPGETHLMLFRVARPLKAGDRFPVTLSFERAGSITVEAVTAAPGALQPPS